MRRIACPRLVGRALMGGLLSMLVLTALTPVAVASQSPAIGGYAPGGPAIVERTSEKSSDRIKLPGAAGHRDTAVVAIIPQSKTQGSGADPERVRLPFTGLQIGMMLVAGLGILSLGLSLRQSSTRAGPFDDYRRSPHPGNSEIQRTLGPRGGP